MSIVSMDLKTEEALVRQARSDAQAFGELYAYYKPHIERYIERKINATREVIEDLTAQVFEKSLRNITKFEWQGYSISAWFYQIARNIVTDYFRAEGKRKDKQLDFETVVQLEPAPNSLEEDFNLDYFSEQLKELLLTLPPREQQIIDYKFFYGYSNQLISKLTHLSVTNVGTILHRVVAKLGEKMRDSNK